MEHVEKDFRTTWSLFWQSLSIKIRAVVTLGLVSLLLAFGVLGMTLMRYQTAEKHSQTQIRHLEEIAQQNRALINELKEIARQNRERIGELEKANGK